MHVFARTTGHWDSCKVKCRWKTGSGCMGTVKYFTGESFPVTTEHRSITEVNGVWQILWLKTFNGH